MGDCVVLIQKLSMLNVQKSFNTDLRPLLDDSCSLTYPGLNFASFVQVSTNIVLYDNNCSLIITNNVIMIANNLIITFTL